MCCEKSHQVFLTTVTGTAKNTVISPTFLVWKFCGKAQFPHSFGRNYSILRSAEYCISKLILVTLYYKTDFKKNALTLKSLRGIKLTHPCGFSKSVFSRERVKPCFFVTFNIIISHIFPENLIEIPQFVQKICRFSPSILTIFTNFSDFLTFFCCKETNEITI